MLRTPHFLSNFHTNIAFWIGFSFLVQAPVAFAEELPISTTYGGIAHPGDIFRTGRGALFPASDEIVESKPAEKPADQPVLPAPPPTPKEKLAVVQSELTNLPAPAPEKAEAALPLARGELGAYGETPLIDNLGRNLALSMGGLLLSTTLDHAGDRFARSHGNQAAVKGLANFGNFLPLIALGAAGLAALDTTDPRLSRTGFAALEAGGAAVFSSLGLKYIAARARPEADLGPSTFHNSATIAGDSSFPSIHTAAIWGAVTPFAKEYNAPWLYGIASLTNFARIAKRKHWVSDTVAGSLLGYWAGDIAWHRNQPKPDSTTQVYIGDNSVTLAWPF